MYGVQYLDVDPFSGISFVCIKNTTISAVLYSVSLFPEHGASKLDLAYNGVSGSKESSIVVRLGADREKFIVVHL